MNANCFARPNKGYHTNSIYKFFVELGKIIRENIRMVIEGRLLANI